MSHSGEVRERHLTFCIVGAGPTGLALAGELALAGVSCAVYERRAEEPNLTRAFAVHARTLELLDARGLADRLLPRGLRVQSVSPAPGASLDLGILPGRYPQLLVVPQSGTELLLYAARRGKRVVQVPVKTRERHGQPLDLLSRIDGGRVEPGVGAAVEREAAPRLDRIDQHDRPGAGEARV